MGTHGHRPVQIVATRDGGFLACPGGQHRLPDGRAAIRALSFAEAEALRAQFDALAPCGGPFWKIEVENTPHPEATCDPQLYALVVGTKQYALFNRRDGGGVIIRKASEHQLGHLRPPKGYTKTQMIDAMWTALIAFADGDTEAIDRLPSAHHLAVGSYPITRPDYLVRLRKALPRPRKGHAAPDPLMPFGRMYIAYPRWSPDDVCPVTLAGPDPDAGRARWVDLGSGRPVELWWEKWPGRECYGGTEVQTLKDITAMHRATVERRYLGPDGEPHEAFQAGELRRRPVHLTGIVTIGKESRRLSEAQHGLLPAADMAVRYDGVPGPENDDVLRATLRRIPLPWLITVTGGGDITSPSVGTVLTDFRLHVPTGSERHCTFCERCRPGQSAGVAAETCLSVGLVAGLKKRGVQNEHPAGGDSLGIGSGGPTTVERAIRFFVKVEEAGEWKVLGLFGGNRAKLLVDTVRSRPREKQGITWHILDAWVHAVAETRPLRKVSRPT